MARRLSPQQKAANTRKKNREEAERIAALGNTPVPVAVEHVAEVGTPKSVRRVILHNVDFVRIENCSAVTIEEDGRFVEFTSKPF